MHSTLTPPLPIHLADRFKEIIGEKYVLGDFETLQNYGHDETEHLLYLPAVVLKPRTAEEISEIMKLCNQYCMR